MEWRDSYSAAEGSVGWGFESLTTGTGQAKLSFPDLGPKMNQSTLTFEYRLSGNHRLDGRTRRRYANTLTSEDDSECMNDLDTIPTTNFDVLGVAAEV